MGKFASSLSEWCRATAEEIEGGVADRQLAGRRMLTSFDELLETPLVDDNDHVAWLHLCDLQRVIDLNKA